LFRQSINCTEDIIAATVALFLVHGSTQIARIETRLSVFISHNLAVVEHMSDQIAVMHQGKVVEYGPVEEIFRAPKQAYTRTLIASAPYIPRPGGRHIRQPQLASPTSAVADLRPPSTSETVAG
jgi:ABC-type dipeptide/oligopeptide/nickel transport system ATPase component